MKLPYAKVESFFNSDTFTAVYGISVFTKDKPKMRVVSYGKFAVFLDRKEASEAARNLTERLRSRYAS